MASFDEVFKRNKVRDRYNLKRTNEEKASHPFNNPKAHEALLKYCFDRLDFGNQIREEFCTRLEDIDKQIYGFQKFDENDKLRDRDNKKGKGPKPTLMNVQLTYAQLDEAVTYLLSVFAPDGEMYKALSSKAKQQVANAFALLMNKHADKRQHYRELSKFLSNAVRYNLGGMHVFWEEIKGIKLSNDPGGKLQRKAGTIWQGNAIKSIDMYNVIWDISVHPVDLPMYGEFVATIERYTPFRIVKMEQDGEIVDAYKYINVDLPGGRVFYRPKPQLRTTDPVSGAGKQTDWFSYLSAGATTSEVGKGIELVNYVGWINPKEFNLSEDDELQVWRLVWAQGKFLTQCQQLANSHSMLPFTFASPNEDDLGLQQRSFGELLSPFQTFGSHLLNVHVRSTRKSLYGITAYDPNILDLGEHDEDVSMRIPAKVANADLKKALVHFNDAPDTQNTLNDFGRVLEIMQNILPTRMLQQVADLQRATQYQSAATVQAGNKRNHKIAKIIDDQALKNMRFMLMYNILEKQDVVDLVGPDGEMVKVNPSDFRENQLEFDIADGLKGIDKLTYASYIKEIINAVIQSPVAGQEVDMLELLNYWTSLMGDRFDLRQFRRKQQTTTQQLEAAQAQEANAGALSNAVAAAQPQQGQTQP